MVVDSYIKESRPISSGYLCNKYNLKYSSATIRNILFSLEQQGFLLHTHTSSGRVPTKDGFKYYVSNLKEEDIIKDNPLGLDDYVSRSTTMTEVIDHTLDTLTRFSGYTSLVAVSGKDYGLFFKGMRFILEQPEFGDIECLRNIFHTLEVRMDELQDLLFKCIGEKIQILIGDDIGFNEISKCSLVVYGICEDNIQVAIALLGPMRMDYLRAASCLYSVRSQLGNFVEEFV